VQSTYKSPYFLDSLSLSFVILRRRIQYVALQVGVVSLAWIFVVKLLNPMQNSDEVTGVVVVLIGVITYSDDLELQPSILGSTC
jgi:hypothetical protein